MHCINVEDVNQALVHGISHLERWGEWKDTRNGKAIVSPHPVLTTYQRPRRRVLFSPLRDANPFFHLMEACWMLAGRNDVESVAKYVSRMRTFSDDGKTFHGAYGNRWRRWFFRTTDYGNVGTEETPILHSDTVPIDQLDEAIQMLQRDPDDRRAVIQMWDAKLDFNKSGRDFPCNTHIYLRVNNGSLDLTVCCRSNDIIWGAYGANAVHFSVLQEYLANCIGCDVGYMYQFSNNYHAYEDLFYKMLHVPFEKNLYTERADAALWRGPIVKDKTKFDEEVKQFFDPPDIGMILAEPWLNKVVFPVYAAHKFYSDKADPQRFERARQILLDCAAPDWQTACLQWLDRREAALAKAKDDGPAYD